MLRRKSSHIISSSTQQQKNAASEPVKQEHPELVNGKAMIEQLKDSRKVNFYKHFYA